jgi:hypothetical protein
LKEIEMPKGKQFHEVKNHLLSNYNKLLDLSKTTSACDSNQIFHSDLKRAIFGLIDKKVEIEDQKILDLIDSDRTH